MLVKAKLAGWRERNGLTTAHDQLEPPNWVDAGQRDEIEGEIEAIELPADEMFQARTLHLIDGQAIDPETIEEVDATKAYTLDGQTFSRKPSAAELAQLPAVSKAQDAALAAVTAVLTDIRVRLIDEGLAALGAGVDSAELQLAANEQERIALTNALTAAYTAGQNTVRMSGAVKSLPDTLRRILKAVLAALGLRVTARIVDEVGRAEMRGMTLERALELAKTVLADEPAAYVEEIASGAAYEAVGSGRNDALVGEMGPGVRFIYSAILDRNTCKKCKADDLKESDDPRKLPHAPNPLCEGRWRCRCQIVMARD